MSWIDIRKTLPTSGAYVLGWFPLRFGNTVPCRFLNAAGESVWLDENGQKMRPPTHWRLLLSGPDASMSRVEAGCIQFTFGPGD